MAKIIGFNRKVTIPLNEEESVDGNTCKEVFASQIYEIAKETGKPSHEVLKKMIKFYEEGKISPKEYSVEIVLELFKKEKMKKKESFTCIMGKNIDSEVRENGLSKSREKLKSIS